MSEEKKNEVAPTGGARLETKPGYKKALNAIFPEQDRGSIWSYIFTDVLIPVVKRAIWDGVTQGITGAFSMLLYGGNNPNTPKTTNSRTVTPYSSQYSNNTPVKTVSGMSVYDFANIEFDYITTMDGRGANDVINKVYDYLSRFPSIPVTKVYEFAGVFTDNYQAGKYGWTKAQLLNSNLKALPKLNGKFYIDFPKPFPIDNN